MTKFALIASLLGLVALVSFFDEPPHSRAFTHSTLEYGLR
jgi:hypothetical protein